MKKALFTFVLLIAVIACNSQIIYKRDLTLQKTTPALNLLGSGATINFNGSDVVLTQSSNTLTMTGGDFALGGGYSLLLTGSIGATGSRITKGWFTDLEVTNAMVGSITGNAATVTGFTPAGGTLTLAGADAVTITTTAASNITLPTSGTIATTAQVASSITDDVPDMIHDSINTRMGQAIDISTLLSGYTGVAGGVDSIARLQFIVGTTTGAPEEGDSVITHSAFAGLDVEVYRDGAMEYYYTEATNAFKHFRFNSLTGTTTVHPPFVDKEQIIIRAFEPTILKTLSIEGEESTLLNDIIACWKLDETSGTSFNDAVGTNHGTTTATVGVTGRIGRAQRFDGLGDYARVPYSSSLSVSGLNTLTISSWIYLDSISIANGQNIFCLKTLGVTYWSALLRIDSGNDLVFYTKNTSGTTFESATNSNLVASTWYHVVAVLDATEMRIYLNGSEMTTASDTFSGTLLPFDDYVYIGTGSSSSVSYMRGITDEPTIWGRVLTEGEITTLAGATSYPYN